MILLRFQVFVLLVLIPFTLMGCDNKSAEKTKETKSAAESLKSSQGALPKGGGSFEIGIIPSSPSSQDGLRAVVSGHGDFTYAWFVNEELVAGESENKLEHSYFKKGDVVSLTVSSGKEMQQADVVIGNAPPQMKEVEVKNDFVFRGIDIQVAAIAEDPDGDPLEYLYTWFINDEEQNFDHDAILPGERFYKGDRVQLYVRVSDGDFESPPLLGFDLIIPNGPPRIVSTPSGISSPTTYEYQVVAEDPDQDVLNFSLETSPADMTIDPTTGLIQWPIENAEMGSHSVTIKVSDPDGGEYVQEFELELAPSQ